MKRVRFLFAEYEKGVREGVMPGIRNTQDGVDATHDALNGGLKNVSSGFLA